MAKTSNDKKTNKDRTITSAYHIFRLEKFIPGWGDLELLKSGGY